jgi:hypothetical protein
VVVADAVSSADLVDAAGAADQKATLPVAADAVGAGADPKAALPVAAGAETLKEKPEEIPTAASEVAVAAVVAGQVDAAGAAAVVVDAVDVEAADAANTNFEVTANGANLFRVRAVFLFLASLRLGVRCSQISLTLRRQGAKTRALQFSRCPMRRRPNCIPTSLPGSIC